MLPLVVAMLAIIDDRLSKRSVKYARFSEVAKLRVIQGVIWTGFIVFALVFVSAWLGSMTGSRCGAQEHNWFGCE